MARGPSKVKTTQPAGGPILECKRLKNREARHQTWSAALGDGVRG
jgi:hypothetical protein